MGACSMHNCFINENDSALSYTKNVAKPDTKLTKAIFDCKKEKKIKLKGGSSFGQPLINANHILFISSENNSVMIRSYNITNKTYNTLQQIKCNDDSFGFNIEQCQYTFDAIDNVIYFINNNQQIMTVNVNTNKLIIHQDIGTDNNNNNSKYMQIEKVEDKVYILGANEEKTSNDNFIFVPYDAYKITAKNERWQLQTRFGLGAVTVHVTLNGKEYIYILGGREQYETDTILSKTIWILNLSRINTDGSILRSADHEPKWRKRLLPFPMSSFGAINYKNKYIIIFGGLLVRQKRISKNNGIRILDLSDGQWYVSMKKLPLKSAYFAVYDNDNDSASVSDCVHLFAWDGTYFTMEIKDIINAFENGDFVVLNLWDEDGRFFLPPFQIKSDSNYSFKNMRPKIDEIDSNDEILV